MNGERQPLPPWSPAQRIAFRFAFCYLGAFGLPKAISLVSFGLTSAPLNAIEAFWSVVTPWVAQNVLRLSRPLDMDPEGGSTQTAAFVQVLCMAALAAAAALVWTVLDRRRTDYRRLLGGLRVMLRYVLGSYMLFYGLSKLIKTQFGFPVASRGWIPYGNMSPLGLLWTFMAYSLPYNLFTGAAEAVPGLLLFFRRTTTLGALLTVAVMAHVVVLNFTYDVPVRPFSVHLLLMGLFLLTPELRRLADLLVLNRPTLPSTVDRRGPEPAARRRARLALKLAFLAYLLVTMSRDRLVIWKQQQLGAERIRRSKVPSYAVDVFVRNGRPVPLYEEGRWHLVSFSPRGFSARLSYEEILAFAAEPGAAKGTWTVYGEDRKARLGTLTLSRPEPGRLVMAGTLSGDSLTVELHPLQLGSSTLMTRGFHWINEAPLDPL